MSAQQLDSISAKSIRNRRIFTIAGSSVATTASYIGLYSLWYKDYSNGKFHFFNDSREWNQMDKLGHTLTCYQIGRLGLGANSFCRFKGNSSKIVLCYVGTLYMTGIEVLDGYSQGWGFSWTDMAANVGGSSLALGQDLLWNEQRIQLKFSFRKSGIAETRPDVLGSNFTQQILKDYNGQTYWISANIASFIKRENKFPKWLNIAFGYGAHNMYYGDPDYISVLANGTVLNNNQYRQYYLSLDADLTKIKTKSKVLKTVFKFVSLVKIPFPAVFLEQGRVKGVWY